MGAIALEPSTSLGSYSRQAWAMEDGLPQNTVQALVQTRDGFVWLGTEVVWPLRGIGFNLRPQFPPRAAGERYPLPAGSPDGTLWIGTSEGLAQWKDGAVTAFATRDGLPGNGIRALGEPRTAFCGSGPNLAWRGATASAF